MNHPVLVSILLGSAVLTVVAGCAGMMGLAGAAARLHYVSFTALLAPPLVMAAVLTDSGLSQAGLKSILIAAVLFVQSPVVAHAAGRAIHSHERLRPKGKQSQ